MGKAWPTQEKPSAIAYYAWVLGSLFFFVEYFIRVSASVLANTLMQTFQATGLELGILFGSFYYTYIIMQLPVGILMDRYSPQRLMMVAASVCALGCLLFALMHSMTMGYLSRLLMGFSAAFGFVGTLKIISLWFAPTQFALFAGITQALGMVGAYVGDAPMSWIFAHFGWRQTMVAIALLLLLLGLALLKLPAQRVKSARTQRQAFANISLTAALKLVLANPYIWLNCLFIGMLYGPTAIFGEQWGPMYISQALGVSRNMGAGVIGWTFIGLAIGCPLQGWLAGKVGNGLWIMRVSALSSGLLLCLLIYGSILGLHFTVITATSLLFLYGICNAGIVPSYAYAAQIIPRNVSGVSLGITNMASVILGAVLSPVVGGLLEIWSTPGHAMDGGYTTADFQMTFLVIPICFCFALLISFFLKEAKVTHLQNIPSNP